MSDQPGSGRPEEDAVEKGPERDASGSGSQEGPARRDADADEARPQGRPDPPDPTGIGDRLEALLSQHREDDAEGAASEGPEPEPYDPFAPPPQPDTPEGEEDADAEPVDDLPDAPLFALLRTMAEEIGAPGTDRVWIFPPRRIEAGETAVVVVAAFTPGDEDRRRVYAAHYTALDDSDQHRLAVDEYGTAPAERVGRLVEEVVERIKDGPAGAPRSVRVGGDERRWNETLHELAEEYLEARQRDRRLR